MQTDPSLSSAACSSGRAETIHSAKSTSWSVPKTTDISTHSRASMLSSGGPIAMSQTWPDPRVSTSWCRPVPVTNRAGRRNWKLARRPTGWLRSEGKLARADRSCRIKQSARIRASSNVAFGQFVFPLVAFTGDRKIRYFWRLNVGGSKITHGWLWQMRLIS